MADNGNRGGNQGGNRSSGSSERGFAAMDEEKQREIARKGGEASAEKQQRDDEGQFAGTSGRGGGSSERGFAAMDDEKQREIARKGGQASGQSRSGSNR
ncbi:MAG TPA: KGG domain-containing protein [Candidatus Limnocylindrales bacterium]|jgi:hypothetical protein|nr:KGG domain-containing protein [Candidatus Limnocylindrales bacterium]